MDRIARLGLSLLLCLIAAAYPAAAAYSGGGEAAPAQVFSADGVVGNGTLGSCTESTLMAALGAGGHVSFSCGEPQTTILFTHSITLTASANLDGAGRITLSGDGGRRLFVVPAAFSFTLRNLLLKDAFSGASDGGAIVNHGRLTLENSTIRDGRTDLGHSGGAIFTDGPLTLTNSLLDGNQAGSGGAVFANTGGARVKMTDSQLTQNQALNGVTGFGGGIWVGPDAQLSFSGGLVFSNSANFGGAIYVSTGGALALAGAGRLSVSGNHAGTSGGAIFAAASSSASLARLDLVGNHSGMDGGAVSSQGALSVDDSLFKLNTSGNGGGLRAGLPFEAVSALPVPVTINHSTFQSNTATQEGGGVLVIHSSTIITITDSVFDGNTATNSLGGGLARYESLLLVARSAFTHNHANSGGGAAITYNTLPGNGGTQTIRDSTFSGNTANNTGGAVSNQDRVQLINVTLKDNSSGFFNLNDVGVNGRLRGVVLQNTGANCEGNAPSDDGSNFATDTSCAFAAGTSHEGPLLNPMLGPLAHWPGGATFFHLPLAGSPLIDQGPSNCSTVDQRGAARVGVCDSGAVEFGGQVPVLWLPLARR